MSRLRKRRIITPKTVAVTPTNPSDVHPATEQFTATVTNVHGTAITFPATCAGTWSSSNTARATINQTGLATTVSAGTTNINFTTVVGTSAAKGGTGISDATPSVYTVS